MAQFGGHHHYLAAVLGAVIYRVQEHRPAVPLVTAAVRRNAHEFAVRVFTGC
jgi:hypothetical protein